MRFFSIFFALLLSMYSNAADNAPTTTFTSETRETDYTIGSVATQHLVVEVPRGYVLDQGSIPEKGQADAIELRDIRWKTEEMDAVTRYKFVIDWQIFVAFETVKSIPLKGLELVFKKEEKSITVSVPPDSVLVSNLLPPKMDEKHVRPYPDVAPQKINMWPFWLGMLAAISTLLVSTFYIAWFMGWITLPSEKNMPFRQAWRQIRTLSESQEDAVQNALKVLGQAVSAYAGHVVTNENVTALCAKTRQLQAFSVELAQLYQDIQRTFFAGTKPTMRLAEVKKLAKQLSQLELS